MASGQDPDTGREPDTLEGKLVRDLRIIARTGRNLHPALCRRMLALPDLQHALAATVPVGFDRRASLERIYGRNPEPGVVRALIEAAIEKLAEAEAGSDSLAEHNKEIRLRVFSIGKRRQYDTAKERWDSIGEYYYQHIEQSKRIDSDSYRRVYYKKLVLTPLVGTITNWDAALAAMVSNDWRYAAGFQESIDDIWRSTYWWLFRIHYHLREISRRIAYWKFNDTQEERIYAGSRSLLEVIFFLRTVKWLADLNLVRFLLRDLRQVHEIESRIFTWFLLTPDDERWLNFAIDSSYKAWPTYGKPSDRLFCELLSSSAHGQHILQKFCACLSSCDCKGPRSSFDKNVHSCSFREFFDLVREYEAGIKHHWWITTTNYNHEFTLVHFDFPNRRDRKGGSDEDPRPRRPAIPPNPFAADS